MFNTDEKNKTGGGFLDFVASKIGIKPSTTLPAPYYQQNPVKQSAFEKKVQDTAQSPEYQASPMGKGVALAGSFLSGIPKAIIQTIPRTIASGLQTSVGLSSSGKIQVKNSEFVPKTDLQKSFLGEKPIKSISEVGKENLATINNNVKYNKIPINPFTMLVAGTLGEAADVALNYGTGGTSAELKALNNSIRAAKTGEEATSAFIRAGFPEETAKTFAERAALATTKKEATTVMNEAAAHASQVVTKKAEMRLAELDAKANGAEVPHPVTGEPTTTPPQILTKDELVEQQYLKKNMNDPVKLADAYRSKAKAAYEAKAAADEARAAESTSRRSVDELTPGNPAEDVSAVNKYKGDISAGKQLDPLSVERNADGTIKVTDGNHRLAAYKAAGVTDIPVKFNEVPVQDMNKAFSQSNTNAVSRATLNGEREAMRLDNPKQLQQTKDRGVLPQDATPESPVTAYRAGTAEVQPGEHVAFTKAEAERYAALREGSKVYEVNGQAKDFVKSEGSGGQFIYAPKTRVFADATGKVDQIIAEDGKIAYDGKGGDNLNFGGGKTNIASPGNLSKYDNFRQNLSDKWTNIVEKVQDKWTRVKKAINEDGKIDLEKDPYVTETLYHGRLSAKIEEIKGQVRTIIDDVEKNAKASGVESKAFNKDVDDYLIAKHAPERNAALGDGAAGMTDEEAAATLERIKGSKNFDKIKETADKISDLSRQTLDILYADGNPWGLIDKETYDGLRKTYKNHIPLNRIMEEVPDSDVGSIISGKGIDVRGSGLKRAKGSDKEVADILTNVATNVTQATTRIEKNLINYDLYRYAEENKGNGWIKARGGVPIGQDFKGNIIMKTETDPNVLAMMVNGKKKYLEFTDPHMADVVKGVAMEHLPPMLNFVRSFSSLLSGLATRFNPEFWVTNKFRDLQDAMIFASSNGKLNAGKQLSKQFKLEGERAVLDHLRGVDSEGARLYKQMLEDGGTTGGMGLSTRKQLEINIDEMRKTAASKPKQVFEAIAKKIDQTNEVIENSTRFNVYKQALEKGATRREAAYLAKESTVNFNRKGTAGPVINALYMFSNASIQGMAKSFKALKNPKTLAATVGTITAATFAVNKYNESIDPEWRQKISPYEQSSGVTVLLPGMNDKGEHNRIVIPLAYSIRFLKSSAEALWDATQTKDGTSLGQALGKVTSSLADGYNPLGGNDVVSTLTPTIADLPVDLLRNKKWSGSKIKPDFDANLPASRQYFDSLKDSDIGKMFISASKDLSDKFGVEISPEDANYVLEQLTSGTGQFVKKTANVGIKAAKGEDIKASEVPFVSRFLKEGDPQALEKFGNRQDRTDIKSIKSEQSKTSFDRKQEAGDFISSLKGKSKDEALTSIKDMQATDKPLYDEVVSQIKDKSKNFSDEDKQIRSLDIKNSGRAKYIMLKLDRLKTKEEKTAFLTDLADKKLLTKEILGQISQLRKQGK